MGTQPLKAIMAARGASQVDVARELGVTNQYISQLANGKVRPSAALAARLAEYLDIDPDALFVEEDVERVDIVIGFVRRTRADSGVPETLADADAEAIAAFIRDRTAS